jgi:predicted membrane-bound spermidine synthase
MAFYREAEEACSKDYELASPIRQTIRTERALLEIVPTRIFGDMLFLDNQLQMSQKDEYIYHEMLVHPAMCFHPNPQVIGILGGGDGCAVREILKWRQVKHIDLFDWDAQLVSLFRDSCAIWNMGSLRDPRVHVHNHDVNNIQLNPVFDVLFIDLLDPDYKNLESKALWTRILTNLSRWMNPTTTVVLNAGGLYPWNNETVSWLLTSLSIHLSTNETHELQAYKVFVPSFGREWCFLMLTPILSVLPPPTANLTESVRYFDLNAWTHATTWTQNYESRIPTRPVKMKGFTVPL